MQQGLSCRGESFLSDYTSLFTFKIVFKFVQCVTVAWPILCACVRNEMKSMELHAVLTTFIQQILLYRFFIGSAAPTGYKEKTVEEL